MSTSQTSAPRLQAGEYREFDPGPRLPSGVRFLPDGATIARSHQTGSIEFRAVATGALLRTLETPNNEVWEVSPSGGRILWSARDSELRLIDALGNELGELVLPLDARYYLGSEAPCFGTLASVGDGTMTDPSTRRAPYRTVLEIAFSGDSRRALVAYGQAYALIWNLETGELGGLLGREGLSGHPVRICRVAWARERDRVATLDSERWLRVWDAHALREDFSVRLDDDPFERAGDRRPGMPVSSILGGGLGAIEFTPDGERIVAGDGPRVRVWEVDSGREVSRWIGHGSNHPILGEHPLMPKITSVAFSRDGSRALTVGVDATIRVWNPVFGNQIWGDRPAPCCLDHADIAPDGRYVFWAACPGSRLYGSG